MSDITESDLHCVDEWEMNKPSNYEFQHVFYYKKTHFVRKVIGTIEVAKKSYCMGVLCCHHSYKKVRWDGLGRCYCGNDNHRNRDYDIHF